MFPYYGGWIFFGGRGGGSAFFDRFLVVFEAGFGGWTAGWEMYSSQNDCATGNSNFLHR
jgi:hypothetical protein